MVDTTLRIIVDPTGAVRGTRVVDNSLGRIRQAFRQTDRSVRTSRAEMAGFGRSLVGALGITTGLIAVVSEMRRVIDQGQRFTSTVAELSAITGAAGADLRELADAAKEIGTSTTVGASAAAEGFKLIASAIPSLLENRDALIAVTKEAITLSEAAGLTLPNAARALGGSLNQFNADADQAGRFINVLAAGSQRGAVEIGDLTQSLRITGAAAATLNLTFEQTIAGLETLGEVQLTGSEAGSNFRNILLALKTTGIDILDPSVNGLAGSLENLNALQLSQVEILQIFGRENFTAASALLARTDRLRELEDVITDTQIAEEQAATATATFEGDVTRLTNALEVFRIEIFEQVEPALRAFVRGATSVVNVINDIVNAIPQTGLAGFGSFFGSATQEFQAVSGSEVFGPPTAGDAAGPATGTSRNTASAAQIEAARAQIRSSRGRANRPSAAQREAERAAQQQVRAFEALENSLRPLEAAQRQSAEAGEVLSRAFQNGTISEEQFRESLMLVSQSLQDQLDPLSAVNRELEFEREQISLTAAERENEVRVRDITQGLQQSGITLSEQETEALRDQVTELQRLNDEQARQQAILESIQGPAREARANLESLSELYASGAINANEFAQASEAQRLVLLDQSSGFADGVERGLIRANQSIGDFADEAERGIARAFGGAEDAIAGFITTTEFNFTGLVDTILQELLRLAIRQAVLAPLTRAFSGASQAGQGSAAVGGNAGTFGQIATVGISALASFQRGGIQNNPTLAQIAERGPEAIIPLQGGSVPVQINDEGRRNFVVQNTFNVQTPDPSTFGRSRGQIETMLGQSINRAISRNS